MEQKTAVILLLDKNTGELILTKRQANLRHHPGEYCFPGGVWDSSDKSLWLTALRELDEELGIHSSRVQFLRALHPELTIDQKIIYPWLASIDNINPFIINEFEVESLLTLPMSEVNRAENYQDISINYKGTIIKSCQYIGSECFVWGATARIMRQLCVKE